MISMKFHLVIPPWRGVTMVLLQSVNIPPSTRNLSIPCAMDGTAWIFLWTGRLMIPLHGKGDLTTIKSSGHSWDHSTFHFRAESIEAVFIKVFETDPPSTYIR
ncbi:hypothetical protein Tco_1407423 [Tanacetum coccineum]